MEELRNAPNAASAPQSRWRTHGWMGLLLIATCWPLNWTLKGVTAYLFFPLWLGDVLPAGAVVAIPAGTSLRPPARPSLGARVLAPSPVLGVVVAVQQAAGPCGDVR